MDTTLTLGICAGLNTRSFKLQDLELVNSTSHPYLEPSVAVFKRIFIYCAVDRTNRPKQRTGGALGILAVFFIESSNQTEAELMKTIAQNIEGLSNNDNAENGQEGTQTDPDFPLSGKGHVWLINGYGGNGSFDIKPPFQKLYRKFQPDLTAEMKFVPNYVSSTEEAMKQANERLLAYQRDRNGPTIVVAQGPFDSKQAIQII